jgi:hypothetical protein
MPLFSGGEKIADTALLPHQQRVVDKIQNQPGILVYHLPGKGKSLSALSSLKKINKPSTVITPAALKSNFLQEQDKHLDTKLPMDMDTLENVARKQTGKKNPVLVVDEAHRARTPGSKTLSALKNISSDAEKTMLLTGTPMVNGPSDIAPLINIVSKEKLLPEAKDEFEKKYVYNKKINPSFLQRLKGIKPGEKQVINKHEVENLRNIFNKWVDYEPGSTEGFPTVEEQDIEVPMSKKQLAIYDSLMGTAPPWLAAKVRSNLPPNKQEAISLNKYLSGARQVGNTPRGFTTEEVDSPKIQRAYEELKKILDVDSQNKGVVYSNFLESGLSPYGDLLKKENIPYGEISGRVPQATRDQYVKDYNEGKLRALLLSPAAQQGLNLKGSTLMQLLDPAWNEPSLDQAKARAIRYQSHEHLPEEKRKVLVQKFLATRPKSLLQRMGVTDKEYAVDEYLRNLSRNKAELVGQFEDLMRPQGTHKMAEEDKKEVSRLESMGKKLPSFFTTHLTQTQGNNLLLKANSVLKSKEKNKLQNASTKVNNQQFLEKRVNWLAKQMGVKPDIIEQGTAGVKPGFPKFQKFVESKLKEPVDDYIGKTVMWAQHNDTDATLLHELGHLKNMKKIPESVRGLYNVSRSLTGLKPALGLATYTALKNDPESNAGLYFLGASAPTLLDEAGASYHALKHLVKKQGLKKGLRSGAGLLPAFGTYALTAAAPLIGTSANKFFNKRLNNTEKVAKIQDEVDKFHNTKDYNLVLKNVSSPKFRKLLIEASDDTRFHNFLNNAGKHFSGREKEKHQVESTSKKNTVYDVKLHKDGSYTCSCPNYLYRRGPDNGECKHIVGLKGKR